MGQIFPPNNVAGISRERGDVLRRTIRSALRIEVVELAPALMLFWYCCCFLRDFFRHGICDLWQRFSKLASDVDARPPADVDVLRHFLKHLRGFFALSLSLTRWISVRVIAFANRWQLGLLPYVVLLGVHFILLMYWRPFVGYIQFSIANGQTSTDTLLQTARMILVHTEFHFPPMAPPPKLESAPVWTDALVAFASNAVRICIALGILAAFIFRKWISGFVDLLKRRLVEEKIPRPFAMILGALGAVAAALNEIAHHFSGSPPIH